MSNINWLPNVDDLSNYISDDGEIKWNDFIENAYTTFMNDFLNLSSTVMFQGYRVHIDKTFLDCDKLKTKDCKNSEFFDCMHCPFTGKYDIFNHICTAELFNPKLKYKKEYKKKKKKIRTPGEFIIARVLLITWIKPIILKCEDKDNVRVTTANEGGNLVWTLELKKRNYKVVMKLPKNGKVIYLKTAYYTGKLTNNDYTQKALEARRNATDGVSTTL